MRITIDLSSKFKFFRILFFQIKTLSTAPLLYIILQGFVVCVVATKVSAQEPHGIKDSRGISLEIPRCIDVCFQFRAVIERLRSFYAALFYAYFVPAVPLLSAIGVRPK